MSVRDLLLRSGLSLTPSEEKIAQVLLADYPAAGLGTAMGLAKRAGVSDPTVSRLTVKLGFDGYPDFQSQLLGEIESRLHSPLLMMEAKLPERLDAGGAAQAYIRSVIGGLERAMVMTPAATYERAARMVSDPKSAVTLVGGRFSRHLAGMLAGYLAQLRSGVRDFGILSPQSFDLLIDIDKHDVLVVFDYRRYQSDVVAFATQASALGARILLFTDPFLSPVAELAEVTIVSPLEAASPYDTMAPAIAQMEALVTQLLTGMDQTTRRRIETLEDIRSRNGVTLDRSATAGKMQQAAGARDFPGPKPARQEQNG